MSNQVYQYQAGVGTICFDLSVIHVLDRIHDRDIIEEQCSLKGITNPILIVKIKSLVNAGADLESILNAYTSIIQHSVEAEIARNITRSRSPIKKEVENIDWVKEGF